MVKKRDLSLLEDEVSISVSLTGLFTAVTLFFVGLLITKFESYDISIKIPILFLIISTFAFLYSTLIFATGSGELARFNPKNIDKNMAIGNTISEYLGVYPFILSVPLVINAITTDAFLRYSTLIVVLIGLIIYHKSGFSIMGRHFKNKHTLFLTLIILLEVALFFSQIIYNTLYYTVISIVLVIFLLLLSFKAPKIEKVS